MQVLLLNFPFLSPLYENSGKRKNEGNLRHSNFGSKTSKMNAYYYKENIPVQKLCFAKSIAHLWYNTEFTWYCTNTELQPLSLHWIRGRLGRVLFLLYPSGE